MAWRDFLPPHQRRRYDIDWLRIADAWEGEVDTKIANIPPPTTDDSGVATLVNNPSSLTRAAVDAAVQASETWVGRQAGVRYMPVLGTIRKSGGTWGIISDASHESTGIASVSANSQRIRITFDHTAAKVGTLLVSVDETYAAQGYLIGASVATTHADLYIYQRRSIAAYITYSGSAWTSNPEGAFRDFSWTSGTLTMAHDEIPDTAGHFDVSITPRGTGNYLIRAGSLGNSLTQVQFYTLAGAAVTSPASNMTFYVTRSAQALAPVDPTTMGEGNSNLWIFGANEIAV